MADPTQSNEQSRKDALAAYYRMRSESLRNSHTVTQDQAAKMDRDVQAEATKRNQQQLRPADMTWIDYIISALAGHPGKR